MSLTKLDALMRELGGVAAGLWTLEGSELRIVALCHDDDRRASVFREFESAASRVSLDRIDLSVARAASEGRVVTAVAETLPPDSGSGYWLRRFGAARSVAVPLRSAAGAVWGVVSVALPEGGPDERTVESAAATFAAELNASRTTLGGA